RSGLSPRSTRAEVCAMRPALRGSLLVLLPAALLAAAVPAAVLIAVGTTTVHLNGHVHFYAVGFSALAAAGAAIALTLAGVRFRDTRTVAVGTAFAVMAALLGLHGLSTPGVVFGQRSYGVVMVTGGATLPVGGALLALAAFPLPRGLRSMRSLVGIQVFLLTAVIGLGAW